jgi:hypothetical protein
VTRESRSSEGRTVGKPVMAEQVQAWGDAIERSYPCNHRKLRDGQRCTGCGLTRNEVALEDHA